jgi:hypothetical protein
MRMLSINTFDTHIGFWQENANDPSFQRDIYLNVHAVELLSHHGLLDG